MRVGIRLLVSLLLVYKNVEGGVTAGQPETPSVFGSPCIRLFHSKGDVGCRAEETVEAPLFAVRNEDDIASFLSNEEDSVVVMTSAMFSMENIDRLRSFMKGLMVYPEDDDTVLSPASKSPQGQGSIDEALNPFSSSSTEWNPNGLDLDEKSFDFPVFLVNSRSDADELILKAEKNIKQGSSKFGGTHKAEMKYYFGKSNVDSIKCLSFNNTLGDLDPKCDPLGGQSSWGTLGPELGSTDVIMAMTSIDSRAFATYKAPGANAGASGVIALLAAADALGSLPTEDWVRSIVFGLFQGESFGFVGSRRFLHDVSRFRDENSEEKCQKRVENVNTPFGTSFCANPITSSLEFEKLNMANVQYAIAVDQVGVTNTEGQFFVHENPTGADVATVTQALTSAASASDRIRTSEQNTMPPGPLSSFLNGNEYGTPDLNAVVLGGYGEAYVSGAYHSRFDVNTTLQTENIQFAAQVLAEALYNLGTNGQGSRAAEVQVNATLVTEMTICVTSNWRCDLMDEILTPFVKSAVDYMSLSSSMRPSTRSPVHLYTSTYQGTRQPVIRKGNSEYAKFTDEMTDDTTLILFPNAYETFIRSFLAYATTKASAGDAASCTMSQDCPKDENLECVYPGRCVLRTSYFHSAFSPGLLPSTSRRRFDVVDASMPLWTETTWTTIGSLTFVDPGNTIGWLSIVIGVIVTGVGVLIALTALRSLRKSKLL